MEAVADYILGKGRVSINGLAKISHRLVDLDSKDDNE